MVAVRASFREKTQPELTLNKLVFIDESGTHPGIGPRRGWSKKGTPLFGPEQPYARGRHVSMIAAIRLKDGVCAKMTTDGGVKTTTFKNFVHDKLVPVLRRGDIVCWDNINLHKNKDVKKWLEDAGVQILSLPPYSPDLNPIEAAWAFVKDWIRKRCPQSTSELKTLMRRALDRIKPQFVAGWFSYCGYNP